MLPTVVASNDTDKVEAMPRSVELWTEFFVDHCLKPDSHPTLSSFFTFRAYVDRMLVMTLFNMPQVALEVNRRHGIMPRNGFKGFTNSLASPRPLRLCDEPAWCCS